MNIASNLPSMIYSLLLHTYGHQLTREELESEFEGFDKSDIIEAVAALEDTEMIFRQHIVVEELKEENVEIIHLKANENE